MFYRWMLWHADLCSIEEIEEMNEYTIYLLSLAIRRGNG